MFAHSVPISAVVFTLVWQVAIAYGQSPPTTETPPKPAPVAISAAAIASKSKAEQVFHIQIEIGTDFEVYSEHKHEFLLPLKVELLNAEFQPVKSKIHYPEPKTIPFDEVLGVDYNVYHGKLGLIATCAIDAKPIYATVFYHGYSKRGY